MDVPRDNGKFRAIPEGAILREIIDGLLTNVPYSKALSVMKGAERWLAASTK
jgi:hypothetical protein